MGACLLAFVALAVAVLSFEAVFVLDLRFGLSAGCCSSSPLIKSDGVSGARYCSKLFEGVLSSAAKRCSRFGSNRLGLLLWRFASLGFSRLRRLAYLGSHKLQLI